MENPNTEQMTEEAARLAKEWWQTQPNRPTAVCDSCNGDIQRGMGFLNPIGRFGSPDLLCRACFDPQPMVAAIAKAKKLEEKRAAKKSELIKGGLIGIVVFALLAYFHNPWWLIGAGISLLALVMAMLGVGLDDPDEH